MRDWVYTYKTSDGLRHEGEMSADCKDDVYNKLRDQGIRAIRVQERIVPVVRQGFRGLKKRDWLILSFVVVVIFVAFFLVNIGYNNPSNENVDANEQVKYDGSSESEGNIFAEENNARSITSKKRKNITQDRSEPFLEIFEVVDALVMDFKTKFGGVDRELLGNYTLLEHMDDVPLIKEELKKGREIVSEKRKAVLDVYKAKFSVIPESCVRDRQMAQKIYGDVMNLLDAAEEELDGDECAITLLMSNKGLWTVRCGQVVWSDESLARQFRLFKRTTRQENNFFSVQDNLN
jgi:hypothetical protein